MEKIVLNEERILTYVPSDLEKEAGIEMFQIYGDINTLEVLSGGNVLLWDDVKNTPYEEVLVKLMMDKDKRVYERQYREVLNSKRNENN